jgi:hypothetical protein
MVNSDFNDLKDGDIVEYTLGKNMRGDCAKNVHKIANAAVNNTQASTSNIS